MQCQQAQLSVACMVCAAVLLSSKVKSVRFAAADAATSPSVYWFTWKLGAWRKDCLKNFTLHVFATSIIFLHPQICVPCCHCSLYSDQSNVYVETPCNWAWRIRVLSTSKREWHKHPDLMAGIHFRFSSCFLLKTLCSAFQTDLHDISCAPFLKLPPCCISFLNGLFFVQPSSSFYTISLHNITPKPGELGGVN